MEKHLQFMGYEIAGDECFYEHFRDKLGYKSYRTYDGAAGVIGSPDFLYPYPERIVRISPIQIIFEEYEDLQGRKNIVYGIHLERKVKNHVNGDPKYTDTAWREFDRLVSMYSHKYGTPKVIYENKVPEGSDKSRIFEYYMDWKKVDGLDEQQRNDLRFFCECRYSKIVEFNNELGRIYLGQSYLDDDLHIVYIDNEAEKIGAIEYNFSKLI